MEGALSHRMYAADVHAPPLKTIRDVQDVLKAKSAV